jgi:hypothetical protein
MTTIFDENAMMHALMNMASAAANKDPKLGQAFVDAGLMQCSSLRRTANRKIKAKARKVVDKWMQKAQRQVEEQMAAGTLDLSPPEGSVAMPGRGIDPDVPETPHQSVERIVGTVSDILNDLGEIPPVFCVMDKHGRGVMLFEPRGHGTREEIQRFFERAVEAGRKMVPEACRYIRANEAWMAPADSPVRPSKSDQRKEIISIIMWDDEAGITGDCSVIEIERDITGKAYAGQVDISCAQGGTTDLDRVYGTA